jgi:carbon-monoxide dehydrogenase large subunit
MKTPAPNKIDTPWVGRSVLRREDRRLLTGAGRFTADIELPRMLHVAFVRSPLAHGVIRSVDVSLAAEAPGVVLAINGAELMRQVPPAPDAQLSLPSKWTTTVQHKFLNPAQPLLAHDKVRFVGEALAVIVADSRYAAEDAAELVSLDLDPLPAAADVASAIAPGAPVLHDHLGTNLIGEFAISKGDVAGALAAAPRRLERRFVHHRYAAMPMECRGVVAEYDRRGDTMSIWSSTQVVHWVRREAAHVLGMPETRVRCVALDVGGGFGVKGHVYPEDLLIPFLARQLGRPVRWIEDRHEHLLCSAHSRDQVHDVAVGYDNDGRILAVEDEFTVDCGAWNTLGAGIAYNTSVHLPGPYKIANYSSAAKIAVTNKVPNSAYRGAGRPEAAFVMERVVDLIARELGLEPAEVRRRNMIAAAEMPYSAGILYRDGEPVIYDSGDYPRALEEALAAIGGVEAFRQRQEAARQRGRHLGLGIGCYVEGTGVGPFEGATVRLDPGGKLYVASGACPQGQGMETIFAQVMADQWKVTPDDVVLALADTAAIAMGFGTIASRSTVTLSAAIHHASAKLRDKVFAIAANMLECAPADLELRDGGVGIVGVPGQTVTLAKIAAAARPGWDHSRPAGVDAGLEETHYWEPPTVTWSYAVHVAIVEVDTELGRVTVEKYAVAHDCGTVVNPLLLDGQVAGGTAQGLGGILMEELAYDENGQLLTGSLMDYLVPTASDMPDIAMVHLSAPSPLNPLGVKGVGEGGAVAPPAAIANAVCDALAPYGVEINRTPIKPEALVAAIETGRGRAKPERRQ